jgi:hypothetical protein
MLLAIIRIMDIGNGGCWFCGALGFGSWVLMRYVHVTARSVWVACGRCLWSLGAYVTEPHNQDCLIMVQTAQTGFCFVLYIYA